MSKKFLFLFTFFLIVIFSVDCACSSEQYLAPEEEWSETFGGHFIDKIFSIQQTVDGGFVLAGATESYGGGVYDSWVIKTNANGNEIWAESFDGNGSGHVHSIIQTSDGGYALHTNRGIIKTDANGNEIWNKCLPGSEREQSIVQTYDGGYLLVAGTSLVKTDANGNIEWKRSLYDFHSLSEVKVSSSTLCSIIQTSDGGYAMAGHIDINYGTYWRGPYPLLIKLDANGDDLWSTIFKGKYKFCLESLEQTLDGGYVLLIDHEYSYQSYYDDYSVILMKTDANGNEIWADSFSNKHAHFAHNVIQTSDGGYALNTNHGIIKTDANGKKVWSWDIYPQSIIQTSDGAYLLALNSGDDAMLLKAGFNLNQNSPIKEKPKSIIAKEKQTGDTVVGDVLVISGKVNNHNVKEATIVLRGIDINNEATIVVKRDEITKFVNPFFKRQFNLGGGYKAEKGWTKTYYYKDDKSINVNSINGDEVSADCQHQNLFLDWHYKGDALGGLLEEWMLTWWFTEKVKGLSKRVKIENGVYETRFDTSKLGGGKYIIEIYTDKLIDQYEINMIPANIEYLSIDRIDDIYGTPITTIVTISNPNNEEKSLKLNLFLDGDLDQSKSFSIAPNSFANVEFTFNDLPVGTHKIKVGTLEETIDVKPVPNLVLHPVKGDIGIGRTLNVDGTSNLPDNTKVSLIIRKGDSEDIFAQETATIKAGKFSASFDTSDVEETVYTVTAKTPDGLSDSIKVTFIKLLSKFEITDLSISHSSVIVGTPITATATVKNNGNIAGSVELTIKVDGIKKESKSITIEPNKIKQVSFTIDEGIGVHKVSMEGTAKTKTFEVKPTPNLILNSISEDIHIGDKLLVSGTTNIPDGISILITAKTDSAQLTPQTVVTSNGRFSTTFNTAGAKQGIYKINAKTTDETSSDLISVYLYEVPPELSISLGLSQKEIVTGQTEKIIVTLTNPTGTPITKVLNLRLDGELKDTRTLTIENIKIAEFIIENPSIGVHLVDVNGYQTQFTVVPIQSEGEIGLQLRADRTTINKGEESILTLSATNIITKPSMMAQFILTIPAGVQVTSTELVTSGGGQYSTTYTIEPGDTRYISARIQGKEKGKFVVEGRVIYHFGDVSDKHDETQVVEITVT